MKRTFLRPAVVFLPLVCGCGNYQPAPVPNSPPSAVPGTSADSKAGTTTPKPAPAYAQRQAPHGPSVAGGIDGETAPAASGGQTAAAKPPVAKKAEAGVGRKGQGYGSDPITAPIRARFRIADKLVFDQVTQAMNLYKAEHEHFPRTHDEFMKGIIEPNNLSLPELPPGEKYEYDPKIAELMVVPDR